MTSHWIRMCCGLAGALALLVSCASTPRERWTGVPVGFSDVEALTSSHAANIPMFDNNGPFRWAQMVDSPLTITPGRIIESDIYRPAVDRSSPVVIMCHGFGSSKESHAWQAERLASWGLHVVVVTMPAEGPWLRNGVNLADLARMIHQYPAIVGPKADGKRIVLAGHSFGGSASVIAAAKGAPVRGLVLLDPAIVSDRVLKDLAAIKTPMILLGADKSVFKSRRRSLFFDLSRGPFREISVRGATHNDAQYPSDQTRVWGPLDWVTSDQRQQAFLRAITASTLSLAVTGKTDWAWRGMISPQNRNTYFGAREKQAARAH